MDFIRDRRGPTLVQWVLLLPAVFMTFSALLGIFIAYDVRSALDRTAFTAAQYLAAHPDDIRGTAELVEADLDGNLFLHRWPVYVNCRRNRPRCVNACIVARSQTPGSPVGVRLTAAAWQVEIPFLGTHSINIAASHVARVLSGDADGDLARCVV